MQTMLAEKHETIKIRLFHTPKVGARGLDVKATSNCPNQCVWSQIGCKGAKCQDSPCNAIQAANVESYIDHAKLCVW